MNQLANFRQRSAVEILDASFHMYREHFAALLAISAAVVLPPAIIAVLVPDPWPLIIDRLGNLLLPLGQGAIAATIYASASGIQRAEHGERLPFGTLIATQIATGFLVIVGLILLIVPGVIALVWTAVALPVVAIERVDSGQAISRSRSLARDHGWHVLYTQMLTYVVTFALIIALGAGLGFVGGLVGLSARLADLLFSVGFAILFPILGVASTLLYIDLRIRKEGIDVEALTASLSAPDNAAPSVS